jgi:SHO1 osmosensor
MHRFQISVFGAIAVVFAVTGVNQGIFSGRASLDAMGAGWLILAIVDILWVLYFTSEEDSLALHIFNSMGTGGLTPPSRRRRPRTQSSVHNMASGNGYASNYASGGGIGSHEPYDVKMGSGIGSGGVGIRSQNSFNAGSVDGGMQNRSIGGTGAGSIHNTPSGGGPGSIGGNDINGPSSPLMAGIGAGGSGGGSVPENTTQEPSSYSYKAKALYACRFLCGFFLHTLIYSNLRYRFA